jgi:hypothetical protein
MTHGKKKDIVLLDKYFIQEVLRVKVAIKIFVLFLSV